MRKMNTYLTISCFVGMTAFATAALNGCGNQLNDKSETQTKININTLLGTISTDETVSIEDVHQGTEESAKTDNWLALGMMIIMELIWKQEKSEYVMSIDYFDLSESGEENLYTIYNPETNEYVRSSDGAKEYEELYAVHVAPCITVNNYTLYDLTDLSGLDRIQ